MIAFYTAIFTFPIYIFMYMGRCAFTAYYTNAIYIIMFTFCTTIYAYSIFISMCMWRKNLTAD